MFKMTKEIHEKGCPEYRLMATVLIALPSLCILTLGIWSASDASFSTASWAAQAKIGMKRTKSNEGIALDIDRVLQWGRLGSRVVALYALCGVAFICTIGLIVLTTGHATAARTIGCVLIVGSWVVFLLSRDAVDRWRAARQVAAALPRFEVAAKELTNHWPQESGEIQPGIKIHAPTQKYPDVLMLRNTERYPSFVTFGLEIERGENGILRFDIAGAYDSSLEYHPNGTTPAAHTSGYGYPSPPVASALKVAEKWFFVRYAEVR